jgi:glycosyltransferase involved in cell wall biosynthesis
VVREARLVVTVTEAMRDGFLRRYPDLPPERFHVIENGFDPEIFDSVSPAPRDRRLTLVHAGSFLAARSPRSFFEALRTVLDEGLVPREEIRVLLVGSAGKEAARLREEMGLADVVAMTGFVPHTECLARQRSADALLLVLPEGESRSDAHTSKLLEYLAAGKPVLALAPEGAAAELLAEAGMRRVVRPEDSRGIVRELRRLYQDWRQGALTDRPASGVAERRARAAQCAKLAGLFREKVFAERGAGGKV